MLNEKFDVHLGDTPLDRVASADLYYNDDGYGNIDVTGLEIRLYIPEKAIDGDNVKVFDNYNRKWEIGDWFTQVLSSLEHEYVEVLCILLEKEMKDKFNNIAHILRNRWFEDLTQ